MNEYYIVAVLVQVATPEDSKFFFVSGTHARGTHDTFVEVFSTSFQASALHILVVTIKRLHLAVIVPDDAY